MNYAPQYRQYLTSGQRIPKSEIKPYGIYKISTYKYVDEGKKTLSGQDETLIFVTGIFQRKVSALKLSNIQPIKFLNWFKKIATSKFEQEMSSNTGLYMVESPMDIGGNRIYDSYIRNNRDFVSKGAAYRTYKLDGIQYVSEVFLKNDIIKRYYG
jgi:hypothetical protein